MLLTSADIMHVDPLNMHTLKYSISSIVQRMSIMQLATSHRVVFTKFTVQVITAMCHPSFTAMKSKHRYTHWPEHGGETVDYIHVTVWVNDHTHYWIHLYLMHECSWCNFIILSKFHYLIFICLNNNALMIKIKVSLLLHFLVSSSPCSKLQKQSWAAPHVGVHPVQDNAGYIEERDSSHYGCCE